MIVTIVVWVGLFVTLFYLYRSFKDLIYTKSYGGDDNFVVVKQEYFIPHSRFKILEKLISVAQDAGWGSENLISKLAGKLEMVIDAQFHQVQSQFDHDFFVLSSKNGFNPEPASDTGKAAQRFLKNFRGLLENANFKELTQEEFDFSISEDYLLTLPIEVKWDKLNGQILKDYVKTNSENFKNSPPFADKIWIYHRGVGVDRTTDTWVMQKIDVLIVNVATWFYNKIHPFVKPVVQKLKEFLQIPERKPRRNNNNETITTNKKIDTNSGYETIQRVRLNDALEMKKDQSLFLPNTLQEPTFKNLIILYATQHPEEKDREVLSIKTFREVPMADLEMIFPEKVFNQRPSDIIFFCVTALVGLISILLDDANEELFDSWAFLTFLALAVRAGLQYYYNMLYYDSLMTSFLYKRTTNSGKGAILSLIEEAKLQEFKEALISYIILSISEKCSEEALGEKCKEFINTLDPREGEERRQLDFDSKDAIQGLFDLKLARLSSESEIIPVSPKDALDLLEKEWSRVYEKNESLLKVVEDLEK